MTLAESNTCCTGSLTAGGQRVFGRFRDQGAKGHYPSSANVFVYLQTLQRPIARQPCTTPYVTIAPPSWVVVSFESVRIIVVTEIMIIHSLISSQMV